MRAQTTTKTEHVCLMLEQSIGRCFISDVSDSYHTTCSVTKSWTSKPAFEENQGDCEQDWAMQRRRQQKLGGAVVCQSSKIEKSQYHYSSNSLCDKLLPDSLTRDCTGDAPRLRLSFFHSKCRDRLPFFAQNDVVIAHSFPHLSIPKRKRLQVQPLASCACQ